MPLDPLSPILTGDPGPIPASTWNRLLELLRRETAQRAGRSGPGPLGDTVQGTTVVLVQNSTGSAVSHGYCLAITDALLDPTDSPPAWLSRPALDGDTPAANDDPFVVLLEPIDDGSIGRAAIGGLAIAQVDVTDTGHGYAAPTPADATKLTSAVSGPARILWKESGSTGTQACVLMLGDGGGGLSSGITVKESDGSPSYASITSLEIDQAQGGVVTQPGTGRAKVSWADASTTQAGVVSTSLQLLAGYKRFTTGVITSGIHLGYFASVNWPSTTDVTDEYHSIISVSGYFQVSGSGNLGSGEGFGMSRADNGNSWLTSAGSILFSNGRVQAATQFSIGDGDITAACELGQTGTYAGMVFTGGILTGGSFTGVTSVAGSGGTTGLSVSGGPITSTGTLTLGGTLVPANGGTGLTTTPPDGSILTGTGSGYAQTSALAFSSKWGVD